MPDDWKTIRIPPEDFKTHNEKRKELDLTWAEYIDGKVEDYRNAQISVDVPTGELRQIIKEELKNVQIDVSVDMAEFESNGSVSRDDVKAWVEREIRSNVADQVTKYE